VSCPLMSILCSLTNHRFAKRFLVFSLICGINYPIGDINFLVIIEVELQERQLGYFVRIFSIQALLIIMA